MKKVQGKDRIKIKTPKIKQELELRIIE